MPPRDETTQIVSELCSGDRRQVDRLFELAYSDLHDVAEKYSDRFFKVVQPTELLHEAFLKLVDQSQVDWRGRSHFMAVGATAMRSILVDLARRKKSKKHGGGLRQVPMDEAVTISVTNMEDVLAIDEALTGLAAMSDVQAKLVESRYFGGMTVAESAEALGISKRNAEKQWTFAKAWLRRELSKESGH